MEQYNIQQNPSPKLPHSPLILDSTDFSLSQTYNPSTKSTNPQRLDSIDPECLSPLTPGSTNPSSFSKPRDCGHKHHKGSNMGQLRVKVFHYLQEKNESMYSLVSEEETPSYSVSTSANTPGYLESAQLRNGSEGSMSRGSSRNEISRQNSEETQTSINRENADISSSVNSQSQTTVSANGSSTQATIDNTLSTNNTDNNTGQTNNAANPSDSGFMDSLEFILEKTPIISIFMSMICLALTAGIAVSVIDGKDTYTFLFIILYVFLIYLIIEKIFKLFRACGTNSPALASLVRLEAFYNMLDVIALLVIAVVVNVRLAEVIESYNAGLYPLIGNFALYSVYSRPPLKQKISGIVKRGLFVAQFFMFMRKAEGELPISWHFVSCFGWILLSKLAIKLVQGIIKVSKAFTGLSILSSISKAAKVTGMIGLFLLGADLGVLMMILAGACSLLDSPDRDIEDLKLWLTICQYLNACLLFFTTIAGADLLEFIMGAAEHFNPFDEVKVKPKQLEFSKQETYVYRMSSTYYKVVEKSEEDSIDENMDREGCEDNTCYICCGNEANGVVLDCGHGGICYDCLKDYITRKEECMECRKKINSVLKIESEVRKDKLFKGEEICSIVRK